MDQYVVMGNPVGHSLSPAIHTLFARETAQQMEYRPLLVPLGEFARAASEFVAGGGRGFNVTLPFKRDAFEWVQARSDEAELSGAVNTVVVTESGECRGENTDGAGLVNDLRHNLGWQLGDATILVVGAGGAAAGILPALLDAGPARLVVANRTAANAERLAARWQKQDVVSASGLDRLEGSFDLVINATSASLSDELPALPDTVIGAKTRCYDLVYAPSATAFNRWAREHGAIAVSDGLGMLVEQAARAFGLWRGVRPATGPVIEQLRAQISA